MSRLIAVRVGKNPRQQRPSGFFSTLKQARAYAQQFKHYLISGATSEEQAIENVVRMVQGYAPLSAPAEGHLRRYARAALKPLLKEKAAGS